MAVVEKHRLIGTQIAGSGWVVAIARTDPADHGVYLYFSTGFDIDAVTPGAGAIETDRRSIGGAPVLVWHYDGPGAMPAAVRGTGQEIPVQSAQTALFAGLNVGLAIRNDDRAETVAHWIAFHQKHHAMNGALIVDRSKSAGFAAELADLVAGLDMSRVLVVRPDFALGRTGLPAEAHPYCAPDAPGKDRMDVPAADVWRAPLGEAGIYDLLKELYLADARAVINIDPCDLILAQVGPVFDRVVASESGVLMLAGRRCYPWRLRAKIPAGFGDHICVQFDQKSGPRRWCLAPGKVGRDAIWRYVRIVGASGAPVDTVAFMRFMSLRHPTGQVSKIVPKSSLVEDPLLLQLATGEFGHKPVRMPKVKMPRIDPADCSTAIVTTMKNEGPFILEWLAYHRVIGVAGFLIYTNDCTDGTDDFLTVLQAKGLVQHRDNEYRLNGLKPQHSALKSAPDEPIIRDADWVICMDVDEYINIKVGDGTLSDLYAHMGDANMISCTWRLFGNADIHQFSDQPVIGLFDRCAPEITRKPHQAWGFKTLFRNIGIFRKLGVHRPKGLNPQLWEQIRWVNGSGKAMPPSMFRNAWRSTAATYGYDVVSLNHYAVRSAESFLVKRDRGRVNHVNRDQGLAYWFRMNNNAERETSIQRMLPRLQDELRRLLSDPEIAAAHAACVAAHRDKISELKGTRAYAEFYAKLTGEKLQRLSRMHRHFGAKIFQAGPDAVPDAFAMADHPPGFILGTDISKTTE